MPLAIFFKIFDVFKMSVKFWEGHSSLLSRSIFLNDNICLLFSDKFNLEELASSPGGGNWLIGVIGVSEKFMKGWWCGCGPNKMYFRVKEVYGKALMFGSGFMILAGIFIYLTSELIISFFTCW